MVHPKAALDVRVSISPYGLFKIQAVKQQLKLYVRPLKPRPHRMGRARVQNVGRAAEGTAQPGDLSVGHAQGSVTSDYFTRPSLSLFVTQSQTGGG